MQLIEDLAPQNASFCAHHETLVKQSSRHTTVLSEEPNL